MQIEDRIAIHDTIILLNLATTDLYQFDFITIRIFNKGNHRLSSFHWPRFADHFTPNSSDTLTGLSDLIHP